MEETTKRRLKRFAGHVALVGGFTGIGIAGKAYVDHVEARDMERIANGPDAGGIAITDREGNLIDSTPENIQTFLSERIFQGSIDLIHLMKEVPLREGSFIEGRGKEMAWSLEETPFWLQPVADDLRDGNKADALEKLNDILKKLKKIEHGYAREAIVELIQVRNVIQWQVAKEHAAEAKKARDGEGRGA
jgi:hypothetical protein